MNRNQPSKHRCVVLRPTEHLGEGLVCDQKGKRSTEEEKTEKKGRVTEAQSQRGKLGHDEAEKKSLFLEEKKL